MSVHPTVKTWGCLVWNFQWWLFVRIVNKIHPALHDGSFYLLSLPCIFTCFTCIILNEHDLIFGHKVKHFSVVVFCNFCDYSMHLLHTNCLCNDGMDFFFFLFCEFYFSYFCRLSSDLFVKKVNKMCSGVFVFSYFLQQLCITITNSNIVAKNMKKQKHHYTFCLDFSLTKFTHTHTQTQKNN